MPIGITYTELKALNPCSDSLKHITKLLGGARKWNGCKISAAEAHAAGATFDDLVWVASALARTDKNVERRLRLWMADCAARVLHIYERHTDDDRPRNAIIAARQFARGEIDAATRAAARAAARDAAWAAAPDAAWAATRDAARDAAWAAARDAARDAAGDAEEAWQLGRLIKWMSDREPADWPLPEKKSR